MCNCKIYISPLDSEKKWSNFWTVCTKSKWSKCQNYGWKKHSWDFDVALIKLSMSISPLLFSSKFNLLLLFFVSHCAQMLPQQSWLFGSIIHFYMMFWWLLVVLFENVHTENHTHIWSINRVILHFFHCVKFKWGLSVSLLIFPGFNLILPFQMLPFFFKAICLTWKKCFMRDKISCWQKGIGFNFR